MTDQDIEAKIIEYFVLHGAEAIQILKLDDGWLIKVPRPERFDLESLSDIVQTPIYVEALDYGPVD